VAGGDALLGCTAGQLSKSGQLVPLRALPRDRNIEQQGDEADEQVHRRLGITCGGPRDRLEPGRVRRAIRTLL
jgi:hypothetical protein